jgi:hypothetical protein
MMTIIDFSNRLEGKAFRVANRAMRAHPSSSPFVSGDSFRGVARHILDMDSGIDPKAVNEGDVVFVETHRLSQFISDSLPSISSAFVLITHNSDFCVDEEVVGLAEDGRIMKWFAQNAVVSHPKLVHIPIGLENRWRHNNGIIGDFRRLPRRRLTKKSRILFGFSVGTNAKERAPALASLKNARAADELVWTNSRAYRRRLNGYRFVASPPGNGVDCHRTWEALYLGAMPIVKRSSLYEGFPNLPVVFVDDWREVEAWGEDRLSEMYDSHAKQPREIPYLWMDYWLGIINAARA